MQTYQIVESKTPKIRCLLCHHLSEATEDVLRRYCPRCARAHIRVRDDVQESLESAVRKARPDLPPQVRAELVMLMLDMLDPSNVYPPAGPIPVTQAQ
jgi:hypothetical protein